MARPPPPNPKAAQRALLDELMGAERDVDLSVRGRKKFWEADVCKFYLAGLSPYKVLRGARGYAAQGYDVWLRHAYAHGLGERPEHIDLDAYKLDGALKAQYDALPAAEKAKYGYDRMLRDCLASLVKQCDRRAAQTATRLRGDGAAGADATACAAALAKLEDLDAKIKNKSDEAERLGEGGDVEESMRALGEADALRARRAEVEKSVATPPSGRDVVVCAATGAASRPAANDAAWMACTSRAPTTRAGSSFGINPRADAQRDGAGPPRHAPATRRPRRRLGRAHRLRRRRAGPARRAGGGRGRGPRGGRRRAARPAIPPPPRDAAARTPVAVAVARAHRLRGRGYDRPARDRDRRTRRATGRYAAPRELEPGEVMPIYYTPAHAILPLFSALRTPPRPRLPSPSRGHGRLLA